MFVGYDDNGQPIFQANLTEAGVDTGIIVRPEPSSTQNIDLKVTIVVTENDGDTEIFEGDIIIKVKPVVDAEVSYTGSATGNEDEFIFVDWKPTGADFPDSDEQILLLRVENIPDGAIIRVDGNEIVPDADGKVRITLLNGLRELIDGTAIIEVKPPEDDSTDFQLTAVLEITEQDFEFEQGETPNEGIALKEIVGLVDINVRPVVEDDATIGIFDQSALDTPLTSSMRVQMEKSALPSTITTMKQVVTALTCKTSTCRTMRVLLILHSSW
ncbi:hypothetical protein JCM19231_4270 [Vibrio ishigakensis]|uniref:RTX toxins n=1 Tax=Vibrio ishigakensis TaxID=1481914 RepID=A0A0B8P0A3_9VIBR|nr:hypothetical protein JCM19231_4270 [Vibrio ishigakensis]